MVHIVGVDGDGLLEVRRVIRAGGLAVIPTDTVYGIVCDPFDDGALSALFAAKHRPRSKSLQVLLDAVESVSRLGLTIPSPLDRLSRIFLPGAFSPICLAGEDCRLHTLRQEEGVSTQAIRVPDSVASRSILAVTGPLAASSANLSGHPSVATVQEAIDQLGDSVDIYVDAGPTPGSTPSTVVAADPEAPGGIVILRQGAISSQAVRRALAGQDGRP